MQIYRARHTHRWRLRTSISVAKRYSVTSPNVSFSITQAVAVTQCSSMCINIVYSTRRWIVGTSCVSFRVFPYCVSQGDLMRLATNVKSVCERLLSVLSRHRSLV